MSANSPASLLEDEGGSRRAAPTPVTAPNDPHKACKVCGDRANGYNFGVLTCESCKAFFRRNAAKEQEIKCPFSNACGITSASRRFCQACRLKKCFSVGMNRDWLTEQKRKTSGKRQKKKEDGEHEGDSEDEVTVSKAYLSNLIRKAKRKATSCECTCTCGFYPEGTPLTSAAEKQDISPMTRSPYGSPLLRPAPSPIQNTQNIPTTSWYENMSFRADSTLLSLPTLPTLPTGYPMPIPSSVISAFAPIASPPGVLNYAQNSCANSSTSNKISEPANPSRQLITIQDYSRLLELSRVSPGTSIHKFARLSSAEAALLQELLRAAAPLNKPLDMQFGDTSQLSLMDVVRITETALRRIVVMARDIQAFTALPIHDRKTLMKGSCSEVLILRGVMAYDSKRKMWSHSIAKGIQGMEVKLDVLKGTVNSQHYDEHKRFLESVDDRVRKTESVILVLMAVIVFEPNRPNLEQANAVYNTQRQYLQLLLRVLECEFGVEEASSMYDRLLVNLRDLRQLNHGLVRIYYGFDSSQLDPLIKELFDI